MLVLSRKIGQSIKIGDNISLTINRISGERVSIAIEAPPEIRILRGELEEAINNSLRREMEFYRVAHNKIESNAA